ncbi:MAG TPA: hypothetical protein VF774_03015 [Pseudoduganella sp.]|jgi:hypothetical protein
MIAVMPVTPAIVPATPAAKLRLFEARQASRRATHDVFGEAAIAALVSLVPIIPGQPGAFAPQYCLRGNTGAPFVRREPA